MPATRRQKPRLPFTALAAFLCWLAAPAPAQSDADTIEVSVRVEDESGQPIPYVTVWSAIEYDRKHVKEDGSLRPLSVDDLWRVTRRYGVLHDIICEVGDKPVAALRVPVMGNADGIFHETLDYEEATGKENHYVRPDPLTFGYTLLKRGYLPGRVGFTVPRSLNRVEAVVTLKRNSDEAFETQAYLQNFARLRYELSDARRNGALTEENQQRVLALPDQMEAAAQQALAAGDKPAAARIYSRMRYMPSPDVVDGRIVGWIEGDASSRQARRAMERAYELDPDSLYVWMQTYLRRRSLLPNPTTEERIAAALYEVDKLIAAKGEAVWPQFFLDQAVGHALLGHFETAYRLYRAAERREPTYMDWNHEIGKLRAEMKGVGMAIPAD
jgi:hypothetical protein